MYKIRRSDITIYTVSWVNLFFFLLKNESDLIELVHTHSYLFSISIPKNVWLYNWIITLTNDKLNNQ